MSLSRFEVKTLAQDIEDDLKISDRDLEQALNDGWCIQSVNVIGYQGYYQHAESSYHVLTRVVTLVRRVPTERALEISRAGARAALSDDGYSESEIAEILSRDESERRARLMETMRIERAAPVADHMVSAYTRPDGDVHKFGADY